MPTATKRFGVRRVFVLRMKVFANFEVSASYSGL